VTCKRNLITTTPTLATPKSGPSAEISGSPITKRERTREEPFLSSLFALVKWYPLYLFNVLLHTAFPTARARRFPLRSHCAARGQIEPQLEISSACCAAKVVDDFALEWGIDPGGNNLLWRLLVRERHCLLCYHCSILCFGISHRSVHAHLVAPTLRTP